MAWKGLHISKPARLSLKDGQILITQDEGEVRMPVEDVAWIVLDGAHATLTSTLVSACMEAGVAIIFTDQRHTPSGIALPFHRHHRQAAVAAMQAACSQPLRKRLWQVLVAAKIDNQAGCLAACGRSGGEAVAAMAKLVGSGDPDNTEARAAREYWRLLFSEFRRDDPDDLRNKMLNYGYAILRAALARAAVASGFIPCFGLFHQGAANAFNLADDLFEPFRPFVDRAAFALSDDGRLRSGDLSIDHRRALTGILTKDARVRTASMSLLSATEAAAESLARAMEHQSAALLSLPRLEP